MVSWSRLVLDKGRKQNDEITQIMSQASYLFDQALLLDSARKAISCNDRVDIGRRIGAETISCLAQAYAVQDGTCAHAVAIFDRYLAAKMQAGQSNLEIEALSKAAHFSSASCACFLLAAKLRDTDAPCVSDLSRITGLHSSNLQEIECDILTTLDWDIQTTTGCCLYFCICITLSSFS
jgi:hypothetical protein